MSKYSVIIVILLQLSFLAAADQIKEIELAARAIRDNSSDIISIRPGYDIFGWEHVSQTNNVTVHIKEEADKKRVWFRSEVVVKGTPSSIAKLINNPTVRTKFDKSLRYVRVLNETDTGLRFAVDTYNIVSETKPREFVYFSKTIAYEGGFVTISTGNYQDPSVHIGADSVRGTVGQSLWELRPVSKTHSNVIYLGSYDAQVSPQVARESAIKDFASVLENLKLYNELQNNEL